jgi:carbohydrate-selective porin OprB
MTTGERVAAGNASLRRFAIASIGTWLLAFSYPAHGQQTTTPNPAPTQPRFECRHPANPHRRPCVCNDEDFDWDETLAGGWSEVRRAAKQIGIVPTASYIGALQTNVTGGNDQVWSYAGQLSFAASTDLGELLKIPGLSAYVGASWGTGSNLAASLNSVIPPTGLYAPSFYLGEMYLQQKLAKKKLTVLAGRLAAGNSFAALPVFTNYVNYGINPNPYSLGANDVTFFGPPTGTEWGAQATYEATSAIQAAAGVFNTNVNSANGANHGADFTLQEGNKGVLAIGEFDYLRNQTADSNGKPGQITVGFLHSNNSFPYLTSQLDHSDGYSGAYLMGQQMVFRPDGPGTSRGTTIWGSWSHNSKDLISPIPWFWGAGLSYEGLIPARKNDVLSVGLIRAEAGQYAPPANTEDLLELNYQWAHSRYLTITPHAQYLWRQDPHEGRNATILGIQLSIVL